MIKRFNISKPETYTKDGQEKTYWANIGTLTEFIKEDGSKSTIIEIPAISLKANVFPIDSKKNDKVERQEPSVSYDEDEITEESLPF